MKTGAYIRLLPILLAFGIKDALNNPPQNSRMQENMQCARAFEETGWPNLDNYLAPAGTSDDAEPYQDYVHQDFREMLHQLDRNHDPWMRESTASEAKLRMLQARSRFYETSDLSAGLEALAYGRYAIVYDPVCWAPTTLPMLHEICSRIDSLKSQAE